MVYIYLYGQIICMILIKNKLQNTPKKLISVNIDQKVKQIKSYIYLSDVFTPKKISIILAFYTIIVSDLSLLS